MKIPYFWKKTSVFALISKMFNPFLAIFSPVWLVMFKTRVKYCFSVLGFIHRGLLVKTIPKLNFSMSFFKNDKFWLVEIPCVMILCYVSFLVMFFKKLTIDVYKFAFEINSSALLFIMVMIMFFWWF